MANLVDPNALQTFRLFEPSDTIRLACSAEPDTKVAVTGSLVLGDQIGSGGVGEVFEAIQPSLSRTVAVKLLRKSSVQRLSVMFENEARITARLNHPNILPVHDLLRIQDTPALVMKRVYGQSWRERIEADRKEGAFHLDAHVRILVNVCRAVGYAHTLGVLHLDIKPANVMVGRFGETLLMDWGCAAICAEDGWEDDDHLPRACDIKRALGTPIFMAPEQARGDGSAIGPSTDIYLLGATLRALMMDEPLHAGTTADEMIEEACRGLLPKFPAEGPEALVRLVQRALEPTPENRDLTAGELLIGLTKWLDSREAQGLVEEAQRTLDRHVHDTNELDDVGRRSLVMALGLFEQAAKTPSVREAARVGAHRARVMLAEAALNAQTPGLAQSFAERLPDTHPEREALFGQIETLTRQQSVHRRAQQRLRYIAAFAALVLVAASVVSTHLYWRTETALSEAQEASKTADALYDFSSNMLASVDPQSSKGLDTVLLETILEDSSTKAFVQFHDEPNLLQQIQQKIALSWHSLGRYDETIRLSEEVLSVLQSIDPQPEMEVAMQQGVLASIHLSTADYETAARYASSAAASFKVLGKPSHEGDARLDHARALIWLSRYELAHTVLNQAIEIYRPLPDALDALIFTYSTRGQLFLGTKNFEGAAQDFQRVLQYRKRIHGDDHMLTSTAHLNLGVAFRKLGNHDKAQEHYSKSLAIRSEILEPNHPRLLTLKHNIGKLYMAQGATIEAIGSLEAALEGRMTVLGPDHDHTISTAAGLAVSHLRLGQVAQARDVIDQTPKATTAGAPSSNRAAARALASVYLDEGRGKEALSLLRGFDGFETPMEGRTKHEIMVDQLVWIRAKVAAGESIDVGTWPSELIPYLRTEVVDSLGLCGQLSLVRGTVEALGRLGRAEEAESFRQEIISNVRSSLKNPDAKWIDSAEQCMAALASVSIP